MKIEKKRQVAFVLALLVLCAPPGRAFQSASDLSQMVERKVVVRENRTIFTLFCLLNAGGYDQENRAAGMHPVRLKVREELSRSLPPELARHIRDYYRQHGSAVAKVMAFCRVSEISSVGGGEVPHAVVVPNLLESYSKAFSFVLGDTFYSIEGPQEKMGYNPHEFVHSITNPMSYDPRYQALQALAQPLFDLAKKQPAADDLKSLQNFLDENLVRAISLKYLDDGDPARSQRLHEAMMGEYGMGYTLEPFFYEQLAEYRKSGDSLATFYPVMLKHLDVKAELSRWQQTGTPGK